jgi:hypothetical protein
MNNFKSEKGYKYMNIEFYNFGFFKTWYVYVYIKNTRYII